MNDNAFLRLRNAIILQAVKDYRRLCERQRSGKRVNFKPLKDFFRSEYASDLTDGKAFYILQILEKERKENWITYKEELVRVKLG